MSDAKGDWYCRNCGYLSGGRVTFNETCDQCHIPVEWHGVETMTEIDRLQAENTKLQERLDRVVEAATEYFAIEDEEMKVVAAWKTASALTEQTQSTAPIVEVLERKQTAREALAAVLEAVEKCEHSKGLTDFCEPCGRIHGGEG